MVGSNWNFCWFWVARVIGFLIEGGVGALAGFLIAGVARLVMVHHMINSLCHTIGTQPYSKRCSAKDSFDGFIYI